MDFFARQDETRRASRSLVLLFALAVLAIVAAITLLVLLVIGQPVDPSIGLFSPQNLQRQAPLLLTAAIGTAGAMALASLFRSASLRADGGKVAQEVGGQRLDADTRDPQLRQLQNVVEEIALAAGVPVPEIYLLEGEDGINAFAAGYNPADAAIAVTRGALDKLDRNELQGVIAHEFSHILNGDMRLNIRLMGLVFGILVLAIVGQRILWGGILFGGGRRRDNSGAAILVIGIGLLAVGYIGLFFGRWIKAAVARQRESLADASAVQFTREPQGLAGALKKIAVYSEGAALNADTEEVNHMLFGEARAHSLFATHPPLLERIRAIEPDFQEEDLKTLAARLQRRQQGEPSPKTESPAQSGGAAPFDADNLIDRIGQVDATTLAAASALGASLPDPLLAAARAPDSAPALILLLLLDADTDLRARQLEAVEHFDAATAQRVRELMDAHDKPAAEQRLPLLNAALPGLKRRSPQQLAQLASLAQDLSEADHRISPFEFLLAQVLQGYLHDIRDPSRPQGGNARLADNADAAGLTLAALADFGHDQPQIAQAAFVAGTRALQVEVSVNWSDTPGWPARLRAALQALDKLAGAQKKTLVSAWIAVISHDRKLAPAEAELLRAFCLAIHVPMPHLIPGQ